MSFYGDYIKERLGKSIIETDSGFATYFYTTHPLYGESVYIEDIYVVPHLRRTKAASQMADRIANEALDNGVKTMLGSVCPNAKGSTESLKTLLGYGMKLDCIRDGLIYFVKQLEGAYGCGK